MSRRVSLDLAELLAAARLAGDVPLPLRLDLAGGDRLAERLASGEVGEARAEVAAALERAADDGPGGAVTALAARELVVDGELTAEPATALRVLAGGALSLQVDLAVRLAHRVIGVRSWLGVEDRLVAQLSTSGGRSYELAWWDTGLWHSQLERVATVDLPVPEAGAGLPAYVSLPSELLVASGKAIREGRTELVAPLAAAHDGLVRLGEPGEVRVADVDETVALAHALEEDCRGRLRVLARRRDRDEAPGVLTWLLFDDGWHELRPGPAATSRLVRRRPADLGAILQPLGAALGGEVAR